MALGTIKKMLQHYPEGVKDRMYWDIEKLSMLLKNKNLQEWQKFILRVCIERTPGSIESLINQMIQRKENPVFYNGNVVLKDSSIKRYWSYVHLVNDAQNQGIKDFKQCYKIVRTTIEYI